MFDFRLFKYSLKEIHGCHSTPDKISRLLAKLSVWLTSISGLQTVNGSILALTPLLCLYSYWTLTLMWTDPVPVAKFVVPEGGM
jgi:hypothetical protein